MKFLLQPFFFAVIFACALQSSPAHAIDKVYSPTVVKGEFETEYGGSTTFDTDHSKDNDQAHEIELEYGLKRSVG